LFRKSGFFYVISVNFIPYWESLHTHTRIAWVKVSVEKCLFAGKVLCLLFFNSQVYLVYFWNANWTRISALYTCVFWKLFGKYFSALFPLFFFRFFCVKRIDGIMGCPNGSHGCLDIFFFFQLIRMIRLIRPDVNSSCPDGRVFEISYVALRPDVT
jgi:hypothetical protein